MNVTGNNLCYDFLGQAISITSQTNLSLAVIGGTTFYPQFFTFKISWSSRCSAFKKKKKTFLTPVEHGKISIYSLLHSHPLFCYNSAVGKRSFVNSWHSLLIRKSEEFITVMTGKIFHSLPFSLRSLIKE